MRGKRSRDLDLRDDEVKALLLELVFDKYDVQYIPNVTQQSIKCPVHDDRVASASANMADGLWVCYTCGAAGTGVHIVQELEEMSYEDAYEYCEGLLDGCGREVSGESDWIPSRKVPKRKRNKLGGGGYRPSWMD